MTVLPAGNDALALIAYLHSVGARGHRAMRWPGPAHPGSTAPRLAAHRVQLVADAAHRIAVYGAGQRWQQMPRVGRGLVGLERLEGGIELAGDPLAAAGIDPPVTGGVAAAATRREHAFPDRPPEVGRGVVLLDGVDVGGRWNVAGAETSADDVNLAADRPRKCMVARGRHRAAVRPGVGCGVVHLVQARDARAEAVFHRLEAANQ